MRFQQGPERGVCPRLDRILGNIKVIGTGSNDADSIVGTASSLLAELNHSGFGDRGLLDMLQELAQDLCGYTRLMKFGSPKETQ